MDQTAMGYQLYSECEGDYPGAREYNVLFFPYLSYNLCRCVSTVLGCHRVLRLQYQPPLSNLLPLAKRIHAQRSSNVLHHAEIIPRHRSSVLKLSTGSMRQVTSPLRRPTPCGFGR